MKNCLDLARYPRDCQAREVHEKSNLYATSVDSDQELLNRIMDAAVMIGENFHTQSFYQRHAKNTNELG